MSQRVPVTIVALSVLYLSLAVPGVVLGQDANTGSIKGEISASGVRSPEDVVVYIQEVPGEHQPPAEPAVVDQKKLVFVPHVLAIVKGTTVTFRNGDPLLHNVMWPASDDGSYPAKNLGTWGQDDSRSFTFDKLGHVVLLCNIHAEMEGHIIVLQNPFFAITGKDGLYEIKNVPPGEYTVTTWYPQPKKLKSKSAKVTVAAGKTAKLDFSLGRRKAVSRCLVDGSQFKLQISATAWPPVVPRQHQLPCGLSGGHRGVRVRCRLGRTGP